MASLPPLTLCLPGALADSANADALARLVVDACAAQLEPDGMAGALAARLGFARQHDWPIAAVVLAHHGVDPGTRYWLRATPVTLAVGRDDVRLAGPVHGLEQRTVEGMIAALNRHFADDALQFVAPRPDDWFVGLPATPDLVTRDLERVIGARVRPYLPRGRDAALWLRWLQEIEMLLHATTEGAAEDTGLPNAVWLQHGGTLPPRAAARHVHVWTDDGDALALATHAGAQVHALPASLDEVVDLAHDAQAIVFPQRDAGRFVPMLARLRSAGRAAEAEIIADAKGMPAIAWRLGRAAWWQRWRRPKPVPLAQLVARIAGEAS